MRWSKKGLIYKPNFDKKSWMYSSGLAPLPILLNEEVIRVYFTARDIDGVGRTAYCDLNSQNPSEIIKISREPVFDIGQPGHFDDNGVVVIDIVNVNNQLRMYYVGFQKVEKVKFLSFTGAAESFDNGESFVRISNVPVLDRANEGLFTRNIQSILYENGVWRTWYIAGSKWGYTDGKILPNYNIKYMESKDGLTFPQEGAPCINTEGNEYRVGRPYVVFDQGKYKMFFCAATFPEGYRLAYAESTDGIIWERCDEKLGINVSPGDSWDSKMMAYPAFIRTSYGTYLFYSGNNYGADGFGYAILVDE
jgi:hypothetical protein